MIVQNPYIIILVKFPNLEQTDIMKSHVIVLCLEIVRPQSNMLKNLIAQNAFENFPKFVPFMLFMLPIMLALCSNMNNIHLKVNCLNVLLEYLRYENRSV